MSVPKSNREEKSIELQRMVQQLYMAQAQVCFYFKGKIIKGKNHETTFEI